MKINMQFSKAVFLTLVLVQVIFACDKNNDVDPWPELYKNVSINQITDYNGGWEYHPKWSHDGEKISFARYNQSSGETTLYIWSQNDGNITTIVTNMFGDFSSSWNPDDTKLAFDARDENDVSQIYIVDLNDGKVNKFTNGNSNSFRPDWSNDGENIVYVNGNSLYYRPIESGNAIKLEGTEQGWNPSWNFHDSKILFSKNGQNEDLHTINADGTDLTQIATGNSSGSENWASWSPDGNSIVYQLFNSGVPRIVMENLLDNKTYLLTEQDDCRFPDWSPDGNSIVYAHDDNLWILTFNE